MIIQTRRQFVRAVSVSSAVGLVSACSEQSTGEEELRTARIPEVIDRAVAVRPSARQLATQALEFYGFIHFTVNTFTNLEWGDGTESPHIFQPEALDARQWVRVMKDAGMGGAILTAKHHDGFCLWPTAYTEHSVKRSPWRGPKR